MKKVGIITFQNANNYGAVYQAFALKKTVEKLGCNVSVINYDSPNMGLKRVQMDVFREFIEKHLDLTKAKKMHSFFKRWRIIDESGIYVLF